CRQCHLLGSGVLFRSTKEHPSSQDVHAFSLRDLNDFPGLLPHLSLLSRDNPLPRTGRCSKILLCAARFAYNPCGGDRAAGTHHALPRLAGALRAAQTNRPLDPAPLALRLGDGRAGLLDALSPVSGTVSGYGESFDSCRERAIMGTRNIRSLTTRSLRGDLS